MTELEDKIAAARARLAAIPATPPPSAKRTEAPKAERPAAAAGKGMSALLAVCAVVTTVVVVGVGLMAADKMHRDDHKADCRYAADYEDDVSAACYDVIGAEERYNHTMSKIKRLWPDAFAD